MVVFGNLMATSYANMIPIDTSTHCKDAYDYQAKYIETCQYIPSTGQVYECDIWYGSIFIYYNDNTNILNIVCPTNQKMEATYILKFIEATSSGLIYGVTGLPSGYSATFLFARNGIYQVYITPAQSIIITYGF